jgi:hypothetical protein
MKASVKCSNCGAEITNLNFSWGKRQWLFIIPAILIGFFPMWHLYKPKGDFRKDLQLTVLEKRIAGKSVEILGTVENKGRHSWDSIHINAEFYSPDGKFVDQASEYLSSAVSSGAKENFKICIPDASDWAKSDATRLQLKVGNAMSPLF